MRKVEKTLFNQNESVLDLQARVCTMGTLCKIIPVLQANKSCQILSEYSSYLWLSEQQSLPEAFFSVHIGLSCFLQRPPVCFHDPTDIHSASGYIEDSGGPLLSTSVPLFPTAHSEKNLSLIYRTVCMTFSDHHLGRYSCGSLLKFLLCSAWSTA